MTAEMVIKDTEIITMAAPTKRSDAQAMALGRGKILALGSNQEMEGLIGPRTQVLSLPGKAVLPGFFDTHAHFLCTGLDLLGPSVAGLSAKGEILESIAEVVKKAPAGEPIIIHGYDAGEVEGAVELADLDRISTQTPIMIGDVGGHACIVNTKAFERIGLIQGTLGIRTLPSGGLSGELVALANNIARHRYYGEIEVATKVAAYHKAAQLALKYGITTVHCLEGGSDDGHGWMPENDVEVLKSEQANLPVGTVIYFQSTRVEKALEWDLPCIGGCLYIDGAYGEHTAALLEPYADDPTTKGSLYFGEEELNAFVQKAHRAGLQISMHAIGDAAIEQLVSAYERALGDDPRADHRHRIEHFSLPTPDQIERVAKLGVAVAMQPNFALMPDTGAEDDFQFASLGVLGPERFNRRHPYRKIYDRGILVAGGSDTNAGPLGPMLGLHALVNHPDQERRLSPYEALVLYTKNGARIGFEEDRKGVLAPGMRADLVVLGGNPLTAPKSGLRDMPIEKTIVAGRVVYDRGRE